MVTASELVDGAGLGDEPECSKGRKRAGALGRGKNGFEEMSPSHAYTKLFFWVNFTFSIDLLKYYSSIFKSGWFSLFLSRSDLHLSILNYGRSSYMDQAL